LKESGDYNIPDNVIPQVYFTNAYEIGKDPVITYNSKGKRKEII